MAWESIVGAIDAAKVSKQQIVESEHLMKALLEQKDGFAKRILWKAGVDSASILKATNEFISRQPKVFDDITRPTIGSSLVSILDNAIKYRNDFGDEFVSVEHILLAFSSETRFGQNLFKSLKVHANNLKDAISALRWSGITCERKYQALEKYGIDLTESARRGKLDPVIGRDREINACIKVLCKMTVNNPLVVGVPGVGKTSIVEGLAQRIIRGDVPKSLMNIKLISLDIGALLAGTKSGSKFEERLQAVVNEIFASNGQIILFIDDIHTVVGAGAGGVAMSAGNLLKPMLGRGQLRCIGATTLDEYRKYIVKIALECRFGWVYCNEPLVEETISILNGLQERFELYHGVKISEEAFIAAAVSSYRYIAERFLPVKAIDLVDEAAAKIKLEQRLKQIEVYSVCREITRLGVLVLSQQYIGNLSKKKLRMLKEKMRSLKKKKKFFDRNWAFEKSLMTTIRSTKEEIDKINIEIEAAEKEHDLNHAAELKHKLLSLQKQLEEAENELVGFHQSGKSRLQTVVYDSDIREVLSKWEGIRVKSLQQSESDKLLQLEDVLGSQVIGQDFAVKCVANAIICSREVPQDPNGPIATFMFTGPRGVGKTRMCKVLADFLFNTRNSLIQIDLSKYVDKHDVLSLVSSLVEGGHREGSKGVRIRPYTVVLFDGIEKAHPDALNFIVHLLKDGGISDSRDRTVVSLASCVVIMTSNAGSHLILDKLTDKEDAKEAMYEIVKKQVEIAKHTFCQEFLNNINYIVFQPLGTTEINSIMEIQLNRVKQQYKKKEGIYLKYTPEAVELLGSLSSDPKNGAAHVHGVVHRMVERKLAIGIGKGDLQKGDTITVHASLISIAEGLAPHKKLVLQRLEKSKKETKRCQYLEALGVVC